MRGSRLPEWIPALLLVFAYGLLIFWAAGHHEVWRDEVRALSLVRASDSLAELFGNLRNEGHPAVWYLLLYAGYELTGDTAILKIVGGLVGVGAVALFTWRAPFSRLEKALFAFGCLPAFEYSVVCRNYGIGMLLLFAACSVYERRAQRPVVLGVLVFLLANTSAHAGVLALALLGSLVIQSALRVPVGGRVELRDALITSAIGGAGVAISIWQMVPGAITTATTLHDRSGVDLLVAIWESLLSQAGFARHLVSHRWVVPVIFVLGPVYLALCRRPSLVAYLLAVVVGLGVIDDLVYPIEALRHQGFVLLGVISAIWLARNRPPEILADDPRFRSLRSPMRNVGRALLVFLLVLQVDYAIALLRAERAVVRSSAKDLAKFVDQRPDFADAIFISEPDVFAETLPYYLDQRIYLPREKKFSDTVSFTDENAADLSLGGLLETARDLSRNEGVPVLLLLGHSWTDPGERRFSFGKVFRVSSDERDEFERSTRRLVRFEDAAGDENYTLFKLTTPRAPR